MLHAIIFKFLKGHVHFREVTGIAEGIKGTHTTHQTYFPMSGRRPSRSITTIITITFTIITSRSYLLHSNILDWEEATCSMYPTTKPNFSNWANNLVHFTIFGCHPCAGAIRKSDDPRRESNRGLPNRGSERIWQPPNSKGWELEELV